MRNSSRHVNSFNRVSCRSEYFIPNVITEWNKLDPDIRSSFSYNLFRNTLLKFMRPAQRQTFNINDSVGIKLLTRLRLDLRERKSRLDFRDILNPLCPCSIEAETTTHCFLSFYFCNANKCVFMNGLNEIDSSLSALNDNNKLIDLIKFDAKKNGNTLMSNKKFLKNLMDTCYNF